MRRLGRCLCRLGRYQAEEVMENVLDGASGALGMFANAVTFGHGPKPSTGGYEPTLQTLFPTPL